MRLEDITIALRPRGPWEALDLGCSLVRRDFATLMAHWAATVLPFWLLLALLMHGLPEWFSLAAWWLKPLYDRIPLFFLSRAAFGERPSLRELWRNLPRILRPNLLSALFLRRLSPSRSFHLPASQLEGQKGKPLRSRIATLSSDPAGAGARTTWVFIKLELAVWLGLTVLTSGFVPDSIAPDFEELIEFRDAADFVIHPAFLWWINLCYLAAITIVEPFYVGAGFGIYLNCRTRLEGWDVELTFRRLRSRLLSARSTAAILLLALALCLAAPAQAALKRENKNPAPTTQSTQSTQSSIPSSMDWWVNQGGNAVPKKDTRFYCRVCGPGNHTNNDCRIQWNFRK